MAAYPFMVQSALNVLNSIFEQWQNEPYRWENERCIQAEIGSRLNQLFALQGLDTIEGDYKWINAGHDKKQTFSRVSYETYVSYEYEEGKRSYCHPDIVIYDELESGEIPPEGQLWPILWACELKFKSPDGGAADVEKLRRLIEQKRIKFGCSVRVHFAQDSNKAGVEWTGTEHGRYLWECDVRMPKEK